MRITVKAIGLDPDGKRLPDSHVDTHGRPINYEFEVQLPEDAKEMVIEFKRMVLALERIAIFKT